MSAEIAPPQITLANGERVQANDHVYVSQTWEARDGTPYSVARIMEFLPPEGANKAKGKEKETFTRVRIAWFYRPGDVSDRQVADSRLLLAAIFSEVMPISHLRAKCYVKHKDKIADLSAWKKRPDRFYFNRLFDPYIKKEFEVILSSDITNLPAKIKDVLLSRYEFVVAEREVVADLTDSIRLCETCSDWCANPETVRCDHCKKYFHMLCVQPPLYAKPSRGYGWTCAACSRRHEDEVDGQDRSGTPPAKAKGPAKYKAKGKLDRNALQESEDHYFKMWPFRYFGQYTVAEDTLDPNDLIFPRSATRVGPRFQTNVSPLPELALPDEVPDRGGDSTIELLSTVCNMSDEQIAEVERRKTTLTSRKDMLYNVDFLTEAICRFSLAFTSKEDFSDVSMKVTTRQRKVSGARKVLSGCLASELTRKQWKKGEIRYTDREWNDDEIRSFNAAVAEVGGELRAVRDEVQTRTMPEIVRYFGKWKNAQLRLKHRQAQLLASSGPPARITGPKRHMSSTSSDDEGSICKFDRESAPPQNVFCGSCKTRDSSVWWKAPKGMASSVLCDVCGLNWRKYGDHGTSRLTRDDPIAAKRVPVEKREGTPLVAPNVKRMKTTVGGVSGGSTPTPPPVKQATCQCCKKPGPIGKVLKCKKCALTVHAATCGAIVDEDATESWLCDLCQNESVLEVSLMFECVLCPRARSDKKVASSLPRKDTGFLRSAKPTEGQGWTHTLCSVYVPEISFADASVMKTVEGVSTIPASRWSGTCSVCGIREGAVIRCSECPTDFHASCAWRAGFKFGFELQSVKASKRDVTTVTTFRGYSGVLTPYVCCQNHPPDARRVFALCDMGHNGETALQGYCRTYKQVAAGHSYPLLRKARRLDALVMGPSTVERTQIKQATTASNGTLDVRCNQCSTEFSPLFYPIEQSTPSTNGHVAPAYLCHRCHWPTIAPAPAKSDTVGFETVVESLPVAPEPISVA